MRVLDKAQRQESSTKALEYFILAAAVAPVIAAHTLTARAVLAAVVGGQLLTPQPVLQALQIVAEEVVAVAEKAAEMAVPASS